MVVSLLGFRPGKIGGTETYLRRLIEHLPAVAAPDEVLFVVDRDLARDGIVPKLHQATLDCSSREILAQRAMEAFSRFRAKRVERFLTSLRPDVILFPQQSVFPQGATAPQALVVHDLSHLVFPQNLTLTQRMFRRASYSRSLAQADRIIAISETTRQTFIDHCGVAPERIVTVPHGYDPLAAVEPTIHCPITGRFVYYPASTYPHKNHAELFTAVARLRHAGAFPYRLVLSGMQTRHWHRLRGQIDQLSLGDVVMHLGFVSPAMVASLYRHAECVLFSSLHEGFGIPVLEAFSHGRKIICSRLPIFDELGVPRPFQINWNNPMELQRALETPANMNLDHSHISWRESAQLTAAVLRDMIQPSVGQSNSSERCLPALPLESGYLQAA